jgi:hypothetical protein
MQLLISLNLKECKGKECEVYGKNNFYTKNVNVENEIFFCFIS